jgi:hypothetical protein
MSVDSRIRKGLTMIDKKLLAVDTAAGYEDLQREVRRDTRRRRALLGAVAAAVLIVTTGGVLLSRSDQRQVQPAGTPTTTFRSPHYGYSIALPSSWTAVAGGKSSDDLIHVPGTDTTIDISADYLGGQSFTTWANRLYHATERDPGVPADCHLSAPLEWPRLSIGATQGYLFQKCNQALGIAPIGNRVYVFIWGNRTFDEGKHYPQAKFEQLLSGVTLPDAATANEPLRTPSSSRGR